MKEKYKDQIKEKREELAKKLGYENLLKIIATNKKLDKIIEYLNSIRNSSNSVNLDRIVSWVNTIRFNTPMQVVLKILPNFWFRS